MKSVHKDFRLNEFNFSTSEELIEYAKTISESLSEFFVDWFSDRETLTVRTSGSTGKPKEITLKKEFMMNSARATGKYFSLFEKSTVLCCLPIDYIAGKMMIVRAMTLGWHLDVIEPSSSPLNNIEKTYDFSAMVPLQLRNSLNKIESIQTLIVGGGVVSYDLEELLQKVSTKIYATYGMTETITHIALRKLNNFSDSNLVSESTYHTLPNVKISTDMRGCLLIEAPDVTDEKVITNDSVEIFSENEFQWKGRIDNVINSGGIKLHPEEIEKKLSQYISARFFVAGITDEVLGEKLVLIIEGQEGLADENLSHNLKKNLSKYEIPKEIFFVSQFIETETRKIQRAETLKTIDSL